MATGTRATRRLMSATVQRERVIAWGSSSMKGDRGDEGTPTPCRIVDHLSATLGAKVFTNRAIGGTTSHHIRVQTGLDRPMVRFRGGRAGTGPTAISRIEHAMGPWRLLRIAGDIGGVTGVLSVRDGAFLWTPDAGAGRARDGRFTSAHRAVARSSTSRHLQWSGKNNILQEDGAQVIRDLRDLIAHHGGAGRVLILGQWVTPTDGPKKRAAVRRVNDSQRREFTASFLDVQELLTTDWGWNSPPISHLRLGSSASARRDVAAGRVPSQLVARDRIHLNGWGYRTVTWGLIDHMIGRGWL